MVRRRTRKNRIVLLPLLPDLHQQLHPSNGPEEHPMRRHSTIYGLLLLAFAAGLRAQDAPAGSTNQQAPAASPNQPAQASQPALTSGQPAAPPAAAQPAASSSTAGSSANVTAPYGEITGAVKSGNVPL